jgi:hypothetical protein
VTLEPEDYGAINWVTRVRNNNGNDRTRLNDILRDALWYYMEKVEGKTREDIAATLPPMPAQEKASANVAQMPKPRKKS